MEEAKPSKELRTLYSKNGKEEAEEERTRALEAVSDSSEDERECDQENPDDFDYEKDKQKKRQAERESLWKERSQTATSQVFGNKVRGNFLHKILIGHGFIGPLNSERNCFTKRRASTS